MNKKDFERIKKELEKVPLKQRYIYLLQLQKLIKEKEFLAEIDTLLKEIESKFSHDKSWKRDVLTTLLNSGVQQDDEVRPLRQVMQQAGVEEIIQQQAPKQEENGGVKYGAGSGEYGNKGYFKKYERGGSTEEYEITPRHHESLQQQKEHFETGGYATQRSLTEELEEHQKGKKRNLYEK